MSEEPLAHHGDGTWRWQHEALPEDAFDAPLEAVRVGVDALQRAVDEGRLSAERARDVAMDARFALGGQEHHLGGVDAEAFALLSDLEDELERMEETES